MNASAEIIDYRYPEQTAAFVRAELDRLAALDDTAYVVIDDDPTGGQTVHDIDVYTSWEEDVLRGALLKGTRMFYIMTNSRSLTAEETSQLHHTLMRRLCAQAKALGRRIAVISRGDSTLRGHYPLEPDVICAELNDADAKELLIPYFREGRRYTVNDVHWMLDGGRLIPVGESEFSKDKTFGYRSSDLKEWVEEKTGGSVKARDVVGIPLEMLRAADYDGVERILLGEKKHIVVNACCNTDLEVFAVAYLRALKKGASFIARTAAAWPKVIGRVSDRGLLDAETLRGSGSSNGGLVIIGSHVRRTTEQFERLREGHPELDYIEFDQHLAVDAERFEREIRRVSGLASEKIGAGESCVIYTRRERLDLNTGDAEAELKITQRIASGVTRVVRELKKQPSFIITKGGITSSDIAVKALDVRHAVILGQIAPAVPVWRLDSDSRCPGMDLIIFPGNVGDQDTLRNIMSTLMDKSRKG